MTIGWSFPPSNGGIFDGFNDAGIETYTGARYNGLAREIIQNSLDAVDGDGKVTVEFDAVKISRDVFPNAGELLQIMQQCLSASGNPKEKAFFENAVRELGRPEILCLKIRDSGTTGMRGDYRKQKGQWHAITKARWFSDKNDPTAGGSFGIGKHASFAVSSLRTVFYGTRYEKNGKLIELAQSKAILMSHCTKDGNDYTSGTGFWGKIDGCQPLAGADIPDFLRCGKQGSIVFIAGFDATQGWQHKITATVISNFFYAIDQGKLEVLIQDDAENIIDIDAGTLSDRFAEIIEMGIDEEYVRNSHCYYRAIKEAPPEGRSESERTHLGHCKMWVLKEEELPKKVALLRKTGMLITDEQKKIKMWPGRLDFAGVFLCDSDKGNRLLREMENPKHDAFEPDRATDANRAQCKNALNDLVRWVKECVDELAKPPETDVDPVKELSDLLPDTDPPERIAGDEGEERDLEGMPVYAPKPLKTPKPQIEEPDPDPDPEPDPDVGVGGAGEGGGGGGDGPGDGPEEGGGEGGTGERGGNFRTVEIKNVRVVPNAEDHCKKKVHFTPVKNGETKISLAFAEDDGVMRKESRIRITQADGPRVIDGSVTDGYDVAVNAKQGERMSLSVTLADEVSDSIAVTARMKISGEPNDENSSE